MGNLLEISTIWWVLLFTFATAKMVAKVLDQHVDVNIDMKFNLSCSWIDPFEDFSIKWQMTDPAFQFNHELNKLTYSEDKRTVNYSSEFSRPGQVIYLCLNYNIPVGITVVQIDAPPGKIKNFHCDLCAYEMICQFDKFKNYLQLTYDVNYRCFDNSKIIHQINISNSRSESVKFHLTVPTACRRKKFVIFAVTSVNALAQNCNEQFKIDLLNLPRYAGCERDDIQLTSIWNFAKMGFCTFMLVKLLQCWYNFMIQNNDEI